MTIIITIIIIKIITIIIPTATIMIAVKTNRVERSAHTLSEEKWNKK